jgi:hypothetical protein
MISLIRWIWHCAKMQVDLSEGKEFDCHKYLDLANEAQAVSSTFPWAVKWGSIMMLEEAGKVSKAGSSQFNEARAIFRELALPESTFTGE